MRDEFYTKYNDFFFKRLTALRAQENVTAKEMSLSIGMQKGYISKIESKASLPTMRVFFYICEYLRVTPKDFFDDGIQDPVRLRELIEDLQGLSPTQLEHVAAIVKELKR